MSKRVVLPIAVVLMTLGALTSPSHATAGEPPERSTRATAEPESIDGEYIVRFADGLDPDVQAAALSSAGTEVLFVYRHVYPGAAIRVSAASVRALTLDPSIVDIEPNHRVAVGQADHDVAQAAGVQQSPPWGLDRSDQRSLPLSGTYTYPTTAAGVNVYVLDTGIRSSHVDFGGRVANGYTAIFDGNGTNDCQGHGTHVAGTIGGATYGIAKGVTIVPVRVLDCDGEGTAAGLIAGLDYVLGHRGAGVPAVANLSLGGPANSTIDAAVQSVINGGVTTVVASGNDGGLACNSSPARVAAAVTVAATDQTDYSPNWSAYGSCLDLFAPGVDIVSASHTSNTGSFTDSGTSMAAPHVAGAAAMLLAVQPSSTPAQIASLINSNATTGVVSNAGSGSPNRLLHTPPGAPPAAPPNDDLASATSFSLTGSSPLVGTNVGATKEPGEPSHAGNAGGKSVWWRFTAPSNGTVTLSTEGSSFDTLLGVYTGTSPGVLTTIASNDDHPGSLWSRVHFPVAAGVTYRVAVDGYGGASGSITLGFTWIPSTGECGPTAPFADVPLGHPFCEGIQWLVSEGITTGFNDGTFRPTNPVSRQAMAAFLYRFAGEPEVSLGEQSFADVPLGHPFYEAIQWLVSEGITTGFNDGTFRPTSAVSRQAMAAFLYRFAGEPVVSLSEQSFADVPPSHPFFWPIQWMAESGLSTGTVQPGGLVYLGVNAVSRQAMAAFLHRFDENISVPVG